MENILEETNFIMKKYKIKANKGLGQNFLVDEHVLKKIVESSNINKEDLIIEIGPGLGNLTKYLLEKAGKVICIELDRKMIDILKDRFFLYDNFEVINEDILKTDISEIIKNEKKEKKLKKAKIVANLPYYITTPIIMKLLEEQIDLESITVMVQKEVADRLIENPGGKNTGAITYTVYYYSIAKEIIEVLPKSFIPEPEVISKVIKLDIRNDIPVDVKDKNLMFKIIKCAFMQRRKTLLNALTNTSIFKSKEQGIDTLRKLNLDLNIRPEKLKLEDFANISNEL